MGPHMQNTYLTLKHIFSTHSISFMQFWRFSRIFFLNNPFTGESKIFPVLGDLILTIHKLLVLTRVKRKSMSR